MFVAVPLFAGAAALAMQGMAAKFVTKSDPFYAAVGSILGVDDLLSTIALTLFVRAALVSRRRAHVHGGYMLATVMLVIPPIVARLNLPAPPTWHLGELIAIAPAVPLLFLPRYRRPFMVFIIVMMLKSVAIASLGFSPAWLAVFTQLPGIWSPLLALPAMALAFAALWTAWRPAHWFQPLSPRSATAAIG